MENHDAEKQDFSTPLRPSRTEPSTQTPSHYPYLPVAEDVASHPFAGRLGGSQRFALPSTASPVESRPADAYRDPTWRSLLSSKEFKDLRLWKLAFIEAVGTCLQTFLSALLGHALIPTATETSVGATFTVSLAALAQIFLISLFVYSAGPITGAHFNPLITMGTFCTRLSSLPRTVLYMVGQCIGAVVGAYLVRAGLGATPEEVQILPGCYIDPNQVTKAETFVLEATMSFLTLFLSFGLGLDPRNESSFGPALSPLLIGISSALCIFCSGFVRKGYLGTSLNPARCLGLMAAGQRFTYHWIQWLGPITAAMFNGILYYAVPPYEKQN